MPRVTPDDVNALLGSAVSTQLVLLSIESASALVDTLQGQGLSDPVLRLIELHVAAHFATTKSLSGTVASERIGDAEVTYRAYSGGQSSPFWDMAVTLSGGLLTGTGFRRAIFDVRVASCR